MRKHLSKTGPQLQDMFDANRGNPDVLLELFRELKHRATPSAKALRKQVEEALEGVGPSHSKQSTKTVANDSSSTRAPQSHEVVACRSCQANLRVAILAERTAYTCPACKAAFEAVFNGAVLQIVWQETRAGRGTKQEEMSDGFARQLLGVAADADFAAIKTAWRKASQQYHPDKHQHLPERLRLAAEAEKKQINDAYRFLERITAADF